MKFSVSKCPAGLDSKSISWELYLCKLYIRKFRNVSKNLEGKGATLTTNTSQVCPIVLILWGSKWMSKGIRGIQGTDCQLFNYRLKIDSDRGLLSLNTYIQKQFHLSWGFQESQAPVENDFSYYIQCYIQISPRYNIPVCTPG